MSGSSQRGPFKEGQPSGLVLNYLAGKIGRKWTTVGLHLGISQDVLDGIDVNEGHDRPYKMLVHWRSTTDSDTPYRDLYYALCHERVGLYDLAKQFCAEETTVPVKHGTPSSVELEKLAAQILVYWKRLGHLLGADEAKLSVIDCDYDRVTEKAYQMLMHWRQTKGSAATYQALLDGLTHQLVMRRDLAEKFCFDDTEIKHVPPEITVRGPLALKAYTRALAEGETCDKRVPVMLIGQDRSGKTSLKKSLRGEPFNLDEESTIGIEVDPSHFKVTSEIWKTGEKDHNSETSISFEYHAARATVENLKTGKMVPSPEEREQRDSLPKDRDNQGNRSDETSRYPKSVQAFRYSEQDDRIPKDKKTEIVKRLKNDGDLEDEEVVHSVLWDFAGQSVYYTTHPLFLTPRAIYLLVNDLSRNPSEKARPVVKQGMYRRSLDSYCLKTNFDYLEFWMSSIASLANQEESEQESAQESVESEVLPEKLPPVFLVCTHADTPYESHSYECVLNIHGQTDRPGHLSKTVSECRCFVFRYISFFAHMRGYENGAVRCVRIF